MPIIWSTKGPGQEQHSGARKRVSCACLLRLPSVLVTLLIFAPMVFSQSADAPLTNASVVRLVKAGFKEKTIIAIINSRPNRFRLETEDLIQLKHSGVSENIILNMLAQNSSIALSDDWENDWFFNSPRDRRTREKGSPGGDIFGSSSGSRSQSRSRGGSGGNENEGNITGSATVRILRPPTEAGGTSLKLEKTPSLNNQEIISLIAAGFSEGTIIKRIQQSPVEFDLSPSGVEDLRKNRVTDPIIAAMTAAMGERER